MGPFGLTLENLDEGVSRYISTRKMMNNDIHIDYVWKKSIFHVFDDVADKVSGFWKPSTYGKGKGNPNKVWVIGAFLEKRKSNIKAIN